jgi:hypothetical protein
MMLLLAAVGVFACISTLLLLLSIGLMPRALR